MTKEDIKKELGIEVETLIKVAPKLEALRQLLQGPIYSQRLAGLIRATKKEDPLDCTYVKMCVIELTEKSTEFQQMLELCRIILEDVNE